MNRHSASIGELVSRLLLLISTANAARPEGICIELCLFSGGVSVLRHDLQCVGQSVDTAAFLMRVRNRHALGLARPRMRFAFVGKRPPEGLPAGCLFVQLHCLDASFLAWSAACCDGLTLNGKQIMRATLRRNVYFPKSAVVEADKPIREPENRAAPRTRRRALPLPAVTT